MFALKLVLLLFLSLGARPHISGSSVGERGGDLGLALACASAAAAAAVGHPESVRDLDLGRDVVPHELLDVVRHDEGGVALRVQVPTQQTPIRYLSQLNSKFLFWGNRANLNTGFVCLAKGCMNLAIAIRDGRTGLVQPLDQMFKSLSSLSDDWLCGEDSRRGARGRPRRRRSRRPR